MDSLMSAAIVSPMILAIGGIACFGYAFLAKGKARVWTGTLAAAFFAVTFLLFLALEIRGFDESESSVFSLLFPNHLGMLIALL